MTSFLDGLERELRAAHPRRRRAARRAAIERGAARAPAAIATVAVIGGATAFVVSTGGDDATHSGAATTSTMPTAPPTPDVIVANFTGLDHSVRAMRDFLAPRRGRVVLTPFSGNRIARTTVFYVKGHRSKAGAVASELGLRFRPMAESGGFEKLGAPLVVAVGADFTAGRTVPLTDPGGARKGSLTTVQLDGERYAEITTPIRRSPYLAVWLRGGDRAKFLGFVATPVTGRDDTLAVALLPRGDVWPELVVSRETAAKPGARPANVLLSASLGR